MNANAEPPAGEPGPADIGAQFRRAAAFLTRLPGERGDTTNGDGGDAAMAHDLSSAMWLFPVVGFGIGGAGAIALGLLVWFGVPAAVAATLTVGLVMWLTGALHEDGLADLADGLGGGSGRDDKLAIMRDSRIGAYGMLTLAVVVIAKIAALATITAIDVGAGAGALIAATTWSRALFAPVMRWLQPARDDGLGALAGTPGEGDTWKGLAVAVLLAALVLVTPTGGYLILILAIGGLAAFVVGWLALRHLGGYTGDVLGGAQQAAEAATLVAASAFISGSAV